MYELKLPDLGEGIAEAEVLAWHVQPGDTVEEDAPLVDVETDKATVTIPSPIAGRVVRLLAEVGDIVQVGQVIVEIEVSGISETPNPAAEPALGDEGEPPSATPEQTAAQPSSGRSSGARPLPVVAAPATRRLARELGVDIETIRGTGPGGRVTPEDVERAAGGPHTAAERGTEAVADAGAATTAQQEQTWPAEDAAQGSVPILPYYAPEPMPDFEAQGPVDRLPVRSVRRKVAIKMATAHILVPQVTHTDEADVTDLEVLRRQLNEKLAAAGHPKVTLTAVVVKLLPRLLGRHPVFNATLDHERGEIVLKRYYNIGVAADSPKGLVVPVVHGADRLSLSETARTIGDLARRARSEELQPHELRGGTFTVSNIGALGGFSPNPIVNYPEVALLGMGRARERAVVRNGEIVPRKVLPLALSFDHRVADGAQAARMLSELVGWLEDPVWLLAWL